MTVTAKVIAHSRVFGAPDLITLECRYPRFIHPEVMTHRVFSRNASSSRAIPTEKLIKSALTDPAMPVEWHYNESGMQGTTLMSEEDACEARALWLEARDHALIAARRMLALKPHKQVINRLLEPFTHITVVVTATEWSNFFALRCHPDADPTMRAVAEAIEAAISGSTPDLDAEWHLPYVGQSDLLWAYDENRVNSTEIFAPLAMISAARCARVSYLNHDGTAPDIDKDLALAKRLLESKHMSPFEHQGVPADLAGVSDTPAWFKNLQGNFTGWNQHRKMLELAA